MSRVVARNRSQSLRGSARNSSLPQLCTFLPSHGLGPHEMGQNCPWILCERKRETVVTSQHRCFTVVVSCVGTEYAIDDVAGNHDGNSEETMLHCVASWETHICGIRTVSSQVPGRSEHGTQQCLPRILDPHPTTQRERAPRASVLHERIEEISTIVSSPPPSPTMVAMHAD